MNAHNWSIKSEEHDCHELFQLIMDVLDEEQTESKKSQKSLNYFTPSHLKENSRSSKSSFHGYFVNQLQCLDCNYKYPLRLESFYCLSLTLPSEQYGRKSSTSLTLTECINNYFKSDHITGMRCENCGPKEDEPNVEDKNKKGKINSTLTLFWHSIGFKCSLFVVIGFIKRQAIAKLPDCLSIQIQRNSWSDQGYEMVKQMSYVQFPQHIKIDSPTTCHVQSPKFYNNNNNLSSLLTQYSNNQFSLKQVGIGGLLGGNNKKSKVSNAPKVAKQSATTLFDQNHQSNPKFQQYELKSAIVHYGSAHSGHFVAYRKQLHKADTDKSDDWLQISDSDIKKCKKYHLFSSNVYMLFYDKVSTTSLS